MFLFLYFFLYKLVFFIYFATIEPKEANREEKKPHKELCWREQLNEFLLYFFRCRERGKKYINLFKIR